MADLGLSSEPVGRSTLYNKRKVTACNCPQLLSMQLPFLLVVAGFLVNLVPACSAITTEYCSNPPLLDHGRATQRGRGILGYPVGAFAYYECEPRFKSKDDVELFRSCEFNGERAVWSDISSECVLDPSSGRMVRRPLGAVLTPTSATLNLAALRRRPSRAGYYNMAPHDEASSDESNEADDDESNDDEEVSSSPVAAEDLSPTPVLFSDEEDKDIGNAEDDSDESDDSNSEIEHQVGGIRMKFKNLVPPWLPAPPAGLPVVKPGSKTMRIGGEMYEVSVQKPASPGIPIRGSGPGDSSHAAAAATRRRRVISNPPPSRARITFRPLYYDGRPLNYVGEDSASPALLDRMKYHGNSYGKSFGKNPNSQAPPTNALGLAIYPAVPLTEHQVTAYAKLPDQGGPPVVADVRDNGPMWNVPVGTHYAPPALNERSRKIRIRVQPENPLFGGEHQSYSVGMMGRQGMPLDAVNMFRSQPPPDPILSRYRYGCGLPPIIPYATPSRPFQRRYSVGSRIAYRCSAGKAPNIPQRLMQTMCIYDDGYAHWTPLDAQCVEDVDVEFPEDQRDASTAEIAKKLNGWRMASEQRPGYLALEKELEVPPVPSPERNLGTARISFAEPAPGDNDKQRMTQYPWPLNMFAGDEATTMNQDEANAAEQDRIIVSKTLFLQPPPFPNPPWRSGTPSKLQAQKKASSCDALFAAQDPPYNPQACRKPPSLQEIAMRSIFYNGAKNDNMNYGAGDDENDDVGMPHFDEDFELAMKDDERVSNMGGYCLGPPPSVPLASPAVKRVLYPAGSQVEYACKPGYAFENGISVRTSCFVPIGTGNSRQGAWNPIIGRCVPDEVANSAATADENDWSFLRRRYGGIRNPEEITRPSIPPPGSPHHVDVNLLPNDRDQQLSSAPQEDSTAAIGNAKLQEDERTCIGDECLPGPGPDELEAPAISEEVNYQVPRELIQKGKLALNIIHDNDRRSFGGSEGVMRSFGDTGFPFNEMYRQKNFSKNLKVANDKSSRPPIEARAYAMSERLMRGGLHGPKPEGGGMDPQFVTAAVLGIVGILGVAFLACKCVKGCASMFSGGFCEEPCPDEDQCDEEGGGGVSDGGDDMADGMVFQGSRKSYSRFPRTGGWRASKRRIMDQFEHSDGY